MFLHYIRLPPCEVDVCEREKMTLDEIIVLEKRFKKMNTPMFEQYMKLRPCEVEVCDRISMSINEVIALEKRFNKSFKN